MRSELRFSKGYKPTIILACQVVVYEINKTGEQWHVYICGGLWHTGQ